MPHISIKVPIYQISHMVSYGDRTRSHAEIACLFEENFLDLPPTSEGAISKIENIESFVNVDTYSSVDKKTTFE
ncbi:hypothetical protein ABEB36_004659 [Hypothenemus hampei]|uniref:Uncharacterized protein n=1 Tax=Hypothenemus hampei TaxID=57062 RepID=A0ABD1F419_HYPHA